MVVKDITLVLCLANHVHQPPRTGRGVTVAVGNIVPCGSKTHLCLAYHVHQPPRTGRWAVPTLWVTPPRVVVKHITLVLGLAYLVHQPSRTGRAWKLVCHPGAVTAPKHALSYGVIMPMHAGTCWVKEGLPVALSVCVSVACIILCLVK